MAFSSLLLILTILQLQQISLTNSSPLLLPLSHTPLSPHTSHHNLLKSTSTRSTSRFHRHRQVSLPLTPGTDYTLTLTLNTQKISLYMDTGSDVVWLPCNPFECILCDNKYTPSSIPYPSPLNLTSTSLPTSCNSPSCSTVHHSLPSSDLCAIAKCPLETIETGECTAFQCPSFYYAYGDGSFVGKLYEDTLMVTNSSSPLMVQKFTFGCAHTALAEPIGVAGFGRGKISLPAQLAKTNPEIGNYFSYCLVSHSFDAERINRPSPLILGRYDYRHDDKGKNEEVDDHQDSVVYYRYTPLLDNPKHAYFYIVGLEGVTIGGTIVKAPMSLRRVDSKGNGGMVVDSGTTFTMLPTRFYNEVVKEFDRQVGLKLERAKDVEENTGLRPCYYGNKNGERGGFGKNVPRFVMHFGGNSSVVMPRRNYFHEFLDVEKKRNVGCLVVMDGGDEAESGGPAGLLGNYQQQGFEVVYDLEMMRLGFARRRCDNMWDALNRN